MFNAIAKKVVSHPADYQNLKREFDLLQVSENSTDSEKKTKKPPKFNQIVTDLTIQTQMTSVDSKGKYLDANVCAQDVSVEEIPPNETSVD